MIFLSRMKAGRCFRRSRKKWEKEGQGSALDPLGQAAPDPHNKEDHRGHESNRFMASS
jgi:hypothetical protein